MIPAHLRAALDTAILRSTPGSGAPTDQLAIRVAVLEVLRNLSDQQPVLLVLDDVHSLDSASAEVLAFAARRLQGRRVKVLAAERVAGRQEPTGLGLLPEPGTEVVVDTLPGPVISELLRLRLGLQPADQVSKRIRDASDGNPFYALELGRAVLRSGVPIEGHEPLLVPDRLRGLLADRLGSLPKAAGGALLLIAAAARPRRDLLSGNRVGLSVALASGVVTCGVDGELRFAHPLLREIVYADAGPEQRHVCHARLAQLLEDPLERARHHALATSEASGELADQLADAALIAVHRGAPATAAELFRLAAERTSDDPTLVAERFLASARHAYDAGLPQQAKAVCAAVLAGPNAAARVGARLLLFELADSDPAEQATLLDEAEEDALDLPGVQARICLYRAEHAFRTGALEAGLAELAQAEKHALVTGDVDLQIEAIALRAPAEIQHFPERAADSLAQAARLAVGRPLTMPSILVRRSLIVSLVRRGDVAEALDEAALLRAEVERAGRLHDLGDVLHLVASVHERAGLCAQAYDAGVLGGRLRAETGAAPAAALVLATAAELNGGTVERAVELAAAAIEAGENGRDAEWSAYAHGLRGRAELLLDSQARAAHHLGRSRSLLRGVGLVDPATFLVDADLAEALVRSGSYDEAAVVLDEAAAETDRLDRGVLRLGLLRARMLLIGFVDDPRKASDALRAAMPSSHPYPLEIGRALLILGELERRARRRAAARSALESAIEAFSSAHCLPWLRFARSRLLRLDAPSSTLTDTERQIVELVRTGATNRQIAAALHVSVKAVEGNLTRLFRRFGVSSRAELAVRPPHVTAF